MHTSRPARRLLPQSPSTRSALVSLILGAAFATAAPAASAQFAKPEDAIKYRKSVFAVTGAHFSRIGAMANGRVPFDAKVAQENAEIVATMSRLPWPAFMEGTDKGDTRAKPEIWKESDKVKAAAARYQEEATKLAAAAKTGQLDALKTAFGATAQTCKACHDSYRKE